MKAGDVIWIEFPGVVQTKRRPAVVLSSSTYHETRPDVIVGLVTSQILQSTARTDFVIQDWRSAGLRLPSAFRAFIVTLPQSAVISTMGTLMPTDWNQVIGRVRIALELDQDANPLLQDI
jgi:mRNA interferase MazF